MAESKRTQKKSDAAAQPAEVNAEDANVLNPQEAQRYDLDDLRNQRHEAARVYNTAATAHLDKLIYEAEAAEREKTDRSDARD